MIRLKFYTALFLLFIPAAICWLQRDLQKVLDDIHYRSRICDITNIAKRSQDRHLYMAEYISNFDGYLDFYQPVGKLRDVSEKYDCPLDPGTYDDCPTDYGYLEEYIEIEIDGYPRVTNSDCVLMKCFIRDLRNIGPIFKQDLIRFDALSSDDEDDCSAFDIFLSAWNLHPVFGRLSCHRMNEAQTQAYALYEYVYYWIGVKDSEWKNNPKPTSNEKCERLYSKGTIQGLRDEIDNLCGSSPASLLCQLEGIMKVADTADKLIDYANNSPAQSSVHLMEAFQIAVNAAIRKMNALYPNWMTHLTPNYYERADYASFKSTINEPSWIKTKFKDISMYLFNNLDNIYNGNTDEGFDISYMLDLLPNNYNCDDISAEFGSVCWTIGVFDGMIKTLKHNALGTTKNVMINTAVDYKAFLEHTQTERLLQLSEMSQNNIITIAEELRDEIVHTIEQSAAETTNQIAGGIQSGFDSLRKHFQEEASFDKAIATADIAYINAEINKYTNSSIGLMRRVAELIEDILYHAMVAALGDQVEAGVKMVAHLLEACNPISWLTGGTSAVGMMDAAADVSQTLATSLELDHLNNLWSSLKFYSMYFVEALKENQVFLENIGKLVESLSADIPPSDFQEQKDKFIKGYNDYSPGVDVEYLTGISTKWELVIDEACDLIDGTSGAVSGGAKIAMGSSCLSAKGEVQKLIALYEEIFDFQFDMMDALTECVRASNSYVSASSVSAGLTNVQEVVANDRNSNVLEELKLLATSSSMAYRFSVLAAKENYCNLLEYREGSRPELCKTHDWNLSNLLSRIQPSYHSTQDFKTVPTRPASSGDKAFIDLKDLYAGKVVRFQIPDSDWLVEKGWISSDDRHKPIFVQRFEVYLPVISSSEKQVSVVAEATVGNQIRRDNDGSGSREYILNPRKSLEFAYKEGHETCRNEIIPNPYNTNCRAMPDLCQVSNDVTEVSSSESVYPSIYAMWHLQLSGYETDDISVPVTNIDLMIGLQTATPVISRRKRSMTDQGSNRRLRRSSGTEQCCEDNMFVNETAMCELCPSNSEAKYNALLCECKPCENGGQLMQGSETCSCLCDSDFNGPLCESRKCGASEFTCNNLQCIPESKYCDKTPDCADSSDEPEGCVRTQDDCRDGFCCEMTTRGCGRPASDKECVPQSFVCDGHYDCSTYKDEATCVEVGLQSSGTTCPDGWLYYADACWHAAYFGNETKTREEAAEYCHEAGGTLAEIKNEAEHWFAYTLFIYTITGTSVSAGDFKELRTNVFGVSSVNQNSGLCGNLGSLLYGDVSMISSADYDHGFWWVGKCDTALFNTSDSSSHDADIDTDTDRCLAIGIAAYQFNILIEREDWSYREEDCGAKADGLICNYRIPEHTSEISQGSNEKSDQEQLGSENVAEIKAILQNQNEKMEEIVEELRNGLDGINDNLRLLIEELQERDDTANQQEVNESSQNNNGPVLEDPNDAGNPDVVDPDNVGNPDVVDPNDAGNPDVVDPNEAGNPDFVDPNDAGNPDVVDPNEAGNPELVDPNDAGNPDLVDPNEAGNHDVVEPNDTGNPDLVDPNEAGNPDLVDPNEAGNPDLVDPNDAAETEPETQPGTDWNPNFQWMNDPNFPFGKR